MNQIELKIDDLLVAGKKSIDCAEVILNDVVCGYFSIADDARERAFFIAHGFDRAGIRAQIALEYLCDAQKLLAELARTIRECVAQIEMAGQAKKPGLVGLAPVEED